MLAEILALLIFAIMFILIVSDKLERHVVALWCAFFTVVLVFGLAMHSMSAFISTLNVRSIFTEGFWYAPSGSEEASMGINWATIIFIFGMMVMVEGMARAGFFRWLCMRLARLVNYKPAPLFVAFMIMSAFLSMFIDSITVILFLAAITVELARLLKFNPVSLIIAEIFCANLGGSATMCGDPPNIIIGTSLHLTFGDFVTNTGIIAGISLVIIMIYFYMLYGRKLSALNISEDDISAIPSPSSAIKSKKDFALSCIIFLCAVSLLVTHARTGLTVAFIGLFIAVVTLLCAGRTSAELIKKIDYKTLLFFVGLFVVVGGLEQTGILETIAHIISYISGGHIRLMSAIIIWVSATASAFVDNIPFAATMIPVIRSLAAAAGVDINTLAWALSMGTDIGGSATPIGASANVVGTSVAAKEGYIIGWGEFCKEAVPATILVVAVSTLIIFARYC